MGERQRTPGEYVELFKKLRCKFCKSTDLMMVGSSNIVCGIFCRSCFETEEISVEEIRKRIDREFK